MSDEKTLPCKDSTSKIVVRLDRNDCLLDFDFSKITCGKEIGYRAGYQKYCQGRHIDEIFKIELDEVLRHFDPLGTEEQFLLYLEWEALRTSIAQYLGLEKEVDAQRYKISSILYGEDSVEICQVIRPPSEMPKKIVSCATRSAGAGD